MQLHSDFKGINNYQKIKDKFTSAGKFVDSGDDLAIDKKRKNAVIEVLRFICQKEFTNLACP